MNITPRILKPGEFAMWNNYVDAHPQGTIFHKTNWLELVDQQVEIFTVWINEEIKAGVALIKTKKNGLAGHDKSLTEEHECINALLGMLKHAAHIDFKLPRGHQSILPYHWNGFESSVSITHIIKGNVEHYLKNLNKNKFRELKKLLLMKEAGELIVDRDITEAEMTHLLQQTSERNGFDAKLTLTKRAAFVWLFSLRQVLCL
jgi:hypothetical protein